MISSPLELAGLVLNVAGVIATGLGLRRTWHDFPPAERFLEPVTGPAARVIHRALDPIRGALARRRTKGVPKEVTGVGASAFGFASDARGRIGGYGPLPPGPVDETLTLLDQRTQEIIRQLNVEIDRLDAAVDDLRKRGTDRDAEVEGRLADLEQSDIKIATGGIRLAALGLFLIGAGELVELVARIMA